MNRKEQYQMACVYYNSKRRNWVIEFDIGFEWWGNCLLSVSDFLGQLNKVKEK